MGPLQALRQGLRRSFDVRRRASRSEFWWLQAWLALIQFGALLVDVGLSQAPALSWPRPGWPLVSGVVYVLTWPAAWSVGVRRLHDTGKHFLAPFYTLLPLFLVQLWAGATDWPHDPPVTTVVALAVLIPLALPVWWLLRRSDPGRNRYGPHPLEVTR